MRRTIGQNKTVTAKDLELEMRIARVELMLGVLLIAAGSEPAKEFYAEQKADILGMFPKSRVCG